MGRSRLTRMYVVGDPTRAGLWVSKESLQGTTLQVSEEAVKTTVVGRSLANGRGSNPDGSYTIPVEKKR